MEATDGITIALGATTTGLVVKELLAWLRSRNQKTEISPTPLPVEGEIVKKQPFVTVGECNRRMCEQGDRLTRIEKEDGSWEYVSDPDRCIGCGICAGVCPCGVWSINDNPEKIAMYSTGAKA